MVALCGGLNYLKVNHSGRRAFRMRCGFDGELELASRNILHADENTRVNYPLLIPELRFLNTFYHTLYGRILSVRCVLPFIVRIPYSKNLNKNNEDFSIQFARQSKWGGCIDGKRHIEKFNEEFYHCFCTGSVRQTVRQHRTDAVLQQHLSAILHLFPSAKLLSLFYLSFIRGF